MEIGARTRKIINRRSMLKRPASTAAEYDEAGQLIQQTMEPLYFTVNVFANNFPENIATITVCHSERFAYLA